MASTVLRTVPIDDEPNEAIRLLHTLEGHTDTVTDIAFMPDGNQLISGSEDKTVRLWDTRSGDYVETLIDWPEKVNAVDISPDGTQFVVGGYSRAPEIWEMNSQAAKKTLEHCGPSTFDADYSPDGQFLVIASTKHVGVFRAPDWNLASNILASAESDRSSKPEFIPNVAVSSDSTKVAYIGVWSDNYDRLLILQDVADLECTIAETYSNEMGGVVTLSPDMTILASNYQQKIELKDTRSGSVVARLWSHTRALCFSPDGSYLASAEQNGSVYLWRSSDWELVEKFPAHTAPARGIRFSPDGRLLASCSEDKTIKIWDVSALTQTPLPTPAPPGTGASDTERRAAQWILDLGGELKIRINGQRIEVEATAQLPAKPFRVEWVELRGKSTADGQPPGLGTHAEYLGDFQHVTGLYLYNLTLENADPERIGNLEGLQQMAIQDCHITDTSLGHFKSLRRLQGLDLKGSSLDDRAIEHLDLPTSLERLHLSRTRITDKCLSYLRERLLLQELFLDETAVTDAGMADVAGLPITRLWLKDTQVGDRGIRELARGLNDLWQIHLSGTKVTPAGIADLRKAFPKCDIVQ